MQFGVETLPPGASFQGGAQPRTPRVKTVILCGAFGATLGDQLRARGDDERNRTFLVSGADGVSRATRPLLALGPDVNAACPLDRWVAALVACPATSDLNDAFIVANKDNVNEFVAWSVGDGDQSNNQKIHRGNVLCNDYALGDARAGPARDLLFAVETALGEDDHVLVIDGGRAPVPGFDLAGFLSRAEAAPGKDAVIRVDLSSGVSSDPSDETLLDLAPAAPGSKRVAPVADITRVTPFDSGSNAGSAAASETKRGSKAALGAATLLRSTTVPLLRRFFDEAGDLEPARHSLGRFFFWLCKRKRVSAVRLSRGDTFPLETPEDVDVADSFYRFYAEEEAKALRSLEPKPKNGPSLTSTTRRDAAAMFGTAAGVGDARKRMLADRFAAADKRCGDARARALEAALDMEVLLPTFFLSLEKEKTSASIRDGALSFVAVGPDGKPAKPLPGRFRDASRWNVSRNKPSQHPCYVTSAVSAYGKKPTAADMPMRWHGVDGDFTSRFAGNYADSGLVTAKAKSKVHASLE